MSIGRVAETPPSSGERVKLEKAVGTTDETHDTDKLGMAFDPGGPHPVIGGQSVLREETRNKGCLSSLRPGLGAGHPDGPLNGLVLGIAVRL